MGLGGTLEYISEIMSSDKPKKKKKQFNTVELKVRMDCDGCELKVKKALSSLSGKYHNLFPKCPAPLKSNTVSMYVASFFINFL